MSRFIDKRVCKRIFGIPNQQKLPTDELHKRVSFVHGVMIGSDYECKDYQLDFLPFTSAFHPNWDKLYSRFTENFPIKEWPVFGERDGYVLFYTSNVQSGVEPLRDWSHPSKN